MKKSPVKMAAEIAGQRYNEAIEAHHNPQPARVTTKAAGFDIMGIFMGNAEVIDHADNEKTADYLVNEYRLAYGRGWRVYHRPERD